METVLKTIAVKAALRWSIVAVMITIVANAAIAETSFVDNFDGASIDSAWQVGGQNGSLSLTANPGSLRYTMQGLGGQDSWMMHLITGWPPSVFLARSVEGTSWKLKAKATYHLRWPGTGAQHGLLWVAFDDGTHLKLDRGIDQWYGDNLLYAVFTETNSCTTSPNFIAPNDVVVNDYLDYTYWYEIIREGQTMTVKYSTDGTNFVEGASGTFASQLPTTQKVVLNANVYASAGSYTDWDYVSLEQNNGVSVEFIPSTTRPKPGETFTVTVNAQGSGFYGMQAQVGADHSRVALTDASYGDLLDPNNRLAIDPILSPDSILMAMSLIGNAMPVSGSGTFAVLTYQAGQTMGPIDLPCAAMAAGTNGVELPITVSGTTIVIDDGIWGAGSISGNVTYPYGSDHSGIQVHLWHNGQLFRTVTTDSQGNFSFAEVKDGTYRITATAPLYVLEPCEVAVSGGGSATVPAMKMLAGDLNSDKVIDIGDLTLMAAAFGTATGQPGFNSVADINKDGKVNILDLTILASHWGVSGN